MNDFTFTERLTLVFCLKFVRKKLIDFVPEVIPDFLTEETIQDLIDELGGNPELNTKRYNEEQIREITRQTFNEVTDIYMRNSKLGKRDELSGVI